MRWFARWLAVGLAGSLVVLWSARTDRSVVRAQQRTPVRVTRIYTGPDGQTHAEVTEVKLPLAPALNQPEQSPPVQVAGGLRFVRTHPGFVNDWHPAPRRQYALTISGRGEIEIAGGQKIRVEPGGILQDEDVTGKGHITRTVGNEDWIRMVVPFADQ